jgi:hypothetical protein
MKLRYEDVAHVEMASVRDRLAEQPTLALTTPRGPLYIAPSGVGVAREVVAFLRTAAESER